MPDQSQHAQEVARMLAHRTATAMTGQTMNDALAMVVGLAVESDLCDEAGVTQRVGRGQFLTAAASNEVVLQANKLQYTLAEGPCVRATYRDDLLSSSDVRTDTRWPEWGPAAADLGIAAIISAHLYDGADQTASLDLYSRRHRRYTQEQREPLRLIAAHASIVLAHFRGTAHLWKAVESRHNIGIAQGILMHKNQTSSEEAFAMLRRFSQDNNRKVHDIAAYVARSHTLPEPGPACDERASR